MELLKYNIRHNSLRLFSLLLKSDKEFYTTWVNGKKIYLRKGSTDFRVFKKIFINQEYNFPLQNMVTNIVDVGANIGLSAVFFALKFPDAQIFAIEPEKSNFDLLKKNIAGFPNIKPILGAVSNTPGFYKIKNLEGEHWNFMLEKTEEPEALGRYFTIDEIMYKFNIPVIDFLKVDIEGGEEMLFTDNFNWLDKVKSLSIELHDFILPGSSNTFFKALAKYAPFTFLNYGENHLVTFNKP